LHILDLPYYYIGENDTVSEFWIVPRLCLKSYVLL